MPNVTMVIPSYWGRVSSDLIDNEKILFDHPTALDETGTLARLLDSLAIFDPFDGQVAIITVANDPAIASQVRQRVDEIIAPYQKKFNVINFSQQTLDQLKQLGADKGLSPEALNLLNLDNYAAVRNMCSIAGILNASDTTIFIDDDEVFTDKDFLRKVAEHLGQSHNGDTIQALAGFYLQPDTYRLDESKTPAWRKTHWDNARAMNEAFDQFIGNQPRLKPTPFVFGGNMALTLDTIKKVPFDPNITRGEDMDFLMNLHINGITFYMDRELSIKHLPPGSDRPAWKKIREDAIRFLYARKKLNDHHLDLDFFQPYPGRFLDGDLETRIIKTNELLKEDYLKNGDKQNAAQCDENIRLAKENPFANFDTQSWLQSVTTHWQQLTSALEGIGWK